jgi:hypothetical protein
MKKESLFCPARIAQREQTLKIGNGKTSCSLGVFGGADFSLPPLATQNLSI